MRPGATTECCQADGLIGGPVVADDRCDRAEASIVHGVCIGVVKFKMVGGKNAPEASYWSI